MGNNSSKHKSGAPLPSELADAATKHNNAYNSAYAQDNENSQNTASSISSILINSQQQNQLRIAVENAQNGTRSDSSPTSPLTIKTDNANYSDDGMLSPRSPIDFEDRNQLTATSIMSVSSAYLKNLDVDECIHRLLESGYSTRAPKTLCLKNSEISAICRTAQEIFMSQPSLIELTPPVKIVGDVHGQYSDLIRLFEMGGFPPSSNYLFLGDYVDRGKQSLETILLLLCYKIKFPENFFLLRGNHECANVTRVYGFYDECKRRSNLKIWKSFIDCFNTLPIAAVVAGKIFCVHGGLSPSLHSMDEIRNIVRPTDVPDYGLLNDLLWSDPSETAADWEDNERGVSYCFGKSVINEFLAKHDFDLVCRAHMVVEDGYEFFNDRTLVTVFSAPNYCGEFDNFGAVMSVSEELLCSFELLTPADHPLAKQRELEKQEKMRNAQQGKAANAGSASTGQSTGSTRRPSPPMLPVPNPTV